MLQFWGIHSVEISYFSITQILLEVNFGDFRSTKSAISTHLKAFNAVFVNSCTYEGWNLPNQTKFRAAKNAKNPLF